MSTRAATRREARAMDNAMGKIKAKYASRTTPNRAARREALFSRRLPGAVRFGMRPRLRRFYIDREHEGRTTR